MTHIEQSLRLLSSLQAARLSGDRETADGAQQRLDEWDRRHGYDRRNNLNLGPITSVGERLTRTGLPRLARRRA